MELQRNAIREKISEIDQKMDDTTSAISEYDEKSKYILDLKFKQSEIERTAQDTLNKQKKEVQNRMDEAEDDFKKAMQSQKECELEIERLQRVIENNQQQRTELIDKFKAEKGRKFYEYKELPALAADAFICPTCGQPLTEVQKQNIVSEYEENCQKHRAKYEADKANFKKQLDETIAQINAAGCKCADRIKTTQDELNTVKEILEKAKADKIAANKA